MAREHVFSLRLTATEFAHLDLVAAAEGRSRGEIARQGIRDLLVRTGLEVPREKPAPGQEPGEARG